MALEDKTIIAEATKLVLSKQRKAYNTIRTCIDTEDWDSIPPHLADLHAQDLRKMLEEVQAYV